MRHAHAAPLRFVGSILGEGNLSIEEGGQLLGHVHYEIDGFEGADHISGSGEIEGDHEILLSAHLASAAYLTLSDGQTVAVSVADPEGHSTAEISVKRLAFSRNGSAADEAVGGA